MFITMTGGKDASDKYHKCGLSDFGFSFLGNCGIGVSDFGLEIAKT
jgi:hypothetical protein